MITLCNAVTYQSPKQEKLLHLGNIYKDVILGSGQLAIHKVNTWWVFDLVKKTLPPPCESERVT